MFNPEELEDIAEIHCVADEITTRTDIGDVNDEGDESYKDRRPYKPDSEEEDESDKPLDS